MLTTRPGAADLLHWSSLMAAEHSTNAVPATRQPVDTDAEFHRGLRDRFGGQYDPPVLAAGDAGAALDHADATDAYEAGYRSGDITP
jgi:hypothetical protein